MGKIKIRAKCDYCGYKVKPRWYDHGRYDWAHCREGAFWGCENSRRVASVNGRDELPEHLNRYLVSLEQVVDAS